MRIYPTSPVVFVAAFAVVVPGLLANDCEAVDAWVSFRNGGPSQSSQPLPTQWSPEHGIAWQAELPGYGQSAPVIHDGRVVVTSVLGPNCRQISVQCFELASGEERWSRELESSVGHPSNYMNARAAPTPIVDADGIYAFFETGDFVCFDWSGRMRWHRNEAGAFGEFQNNHGIGSSPAADDDTLYLLIEHDGPSSLTAIDKATGETRWSTDRASTKSWASPITASVNGEGQVIVSSGGTVTAYRASDGDEVWSIDGIEGNSVPSPVFSANRLLVAARLPEFASDGQVRANCCLNLGQMTNGKPEVLWRAEKAISEYASPVICGQHAYFVNKANVLHCIETTTGEVVYRKRLSLDCWATPIVAGELIYFFAKNGQAKIVRAGPDYEEVATNALWDVSDSPTPLRYVESQGGSGHGGGSHGGHGVVESDPSTPSHPHAEQSASAEGGRESSGKPGGGMLARMMAGDANGDSVLEGEEIPGMFRSMLPRIDTDGDGKLTRDEVESMARSFAERRKDAAASARDPIVYGAAAADGALVIRTGTRLYVVSGDL